MSLSRSHDREEDNKDNSIKRANTVGTGLSSASTVKNVQRVLPVPPSWGTHPSIDQRIEQRRSLKKPRGNTTQWKPEDISPTTFWNQPSLRRITDRTSATREHPHHITNLLPSKTILIYLRNCLNNGPEIKEDNR
ncbi:hypothetical protein K0M31_006656 [Melipona bicolor]|uniref:Uncharacterized protein n=1 Tax=Melipona bicolor TaxID=60889 RepID=A0AA40FS61_9HYME|nr:hypothetical protein K0M31_006656 [Melipona bicolor]